MTNQEGTFLKEVIERNSETSLSMDLERCLSIFLLRKFSISQHKFNFSNEYFFSLLSKIKKQEIKNFYDLFRVYEKEIGVDAVRKLNEEFYETSKDKKAELATILPKELLEILENSPEENFEQNVFEELKRKGFSSEVLDSISPQDFILELSDKISEDWIKEVIFSDEFEENSFSLFKNRIQSIIDYNSRLLKISSNEVLIPANIMCLSSFLGLNTFNIPVIVRGVSFDSIDGIESEEKVREIFKNASSDNVSILSVSDLGVVDIETVFVNPFLETIEEKSLDGLFYSNRINNKGSFILAIPFEDFYKIRNKTVEKGRELGKHDVSDIFNEELDKVPNILDFSNVHEFQVFSNFPGFYGITMVTWNNIYLRKSFCLFFKDSRIKDESPLQLIKDIPSLSSFIRN